MSLRAVQFRLEGLPALLAQLALFAFACLAVSPVPLALWGATQNLERYAVAALPEDDRGLEAWYLDHGARWAIVERVVSDERGPEIHVDFRGRGIWRLDQPPLEPPLHWATVPGTCAVGSGRCSLGRRCRHFF